MQPSNLYSVHETLKSIYKNPCHYNKKNPFNELLFIICSLRTEEKQYLASYSRLRKEFPRAIDFKHADLRSVAQAIGPAGLSIQKARIILSCVKEINRAFGKISLHKLKEWDNKRCEIFLTSLSGVGLKTARCVMMYSLDREVFPVDSHCWRIGLRLGWVRNTTADGQPRQKEMDRYQSKVPCNFRYSLHVNMVSFGRDICISRKPKCHACPLIITCKRIGV